MPSFSQQIKRRQNDPEILYYGALKTRSLCLCFAPHMAVMVTSNLYQALGRPVGNMILSMSRQLLVLVPLMLILPSRFGAEGLAVTQALSNVISFVVLALPLALHMLHKIGNRPDGSPAPFSSKLRR